MVAQAPRRNHAHNLAHSCGDAPVAQEVARIWRHKRRAVSRIAPIVNHGGSAARPKRNKHPGKPRARLNVDVAKADDGIRANRQQPALAAIQRGRHAVGVNLNLARRVYHFHHYLGVKRGLAQLGA